MRCVRFGRVSRVAKGADCKSAGLRLRRFESYLSHQPSLAPQATAGEPASAKDARRSLLTAEVRLRTKAVGEGGLYFGGASVGKPAFIAKVARRSFSEGGPCVEGSGY